jgi:repressor LexA
MEPLTRRQKRVLNFIKAHLSKRGYPPTRREIADSIGASSANAGQDHLQALSRKGYVILSKDIPRGIKIRNGGKS